jgi:dienelactone hydrolase
MAQAQDDKPADDAQFKGEFIYLRDYGTDDIGYLTLPDEPPKAGVVIVPDGHGVDAWLKITADVIAKKGYVVLVPDLYNGNVTAGDRQAARMETDLTEKGVLASMKTATVFFQQSPRFKTDKVFVIGLGPLSHYLLSFAAQKNIAINGVAVINPAKEPAVDELKRVRYPVLFQLSGGSPVSAAMNRMVREIGYQDLLEIQPIARLNPATRRMDEEQWKQLESFIQKNSAEERRKSLLQSLQRIF